MRSARLRERLWQKANEITATLLLGILATLLVALLVGLVAAMFGLFRPVIVLPTVAIMSVLAFRFIPRPKVSNHFVLPMVAIVATLSVFNTTKTAQHLLVYRDPGVYVTNALWISNNGSLLVDAGSDFPNVDPPFELASRGLTPSDRAGRLTMHFLHLFPIALAYGKWVSLEGLFATPAILGALGVAFFFLLASRLVPPPAAFLAALVLALNPLQLYFSRDAYSELLVQPVVFGGLWILLEAVKTKSGRHAFVGGLAVGASMAARLDALVFVIPLLLVWSIRNTNAGGHGIWKFARIGCVISLTIGLADAYLFGQQYLADQRQELVGLVAGAILSTLLFMASSSTLVHHVEKFDWAPMRRFIAVILMLGIAGLGVYGLTLRPALEEGHGPAAPSVMSLQIRQGLDPEPTKTYSEWTITWLSWYLGPVLLVAGFLGWGYIAREVTTGRSLRFFDPLIVFSAPTLLYLFRPSINPDQIWAMRRFVHITVPGLIVLAFAFVVWLTTRASYGPRVLGICIVLLGFGSSFTWLHLSIPAQREWQLLQSSKVLCEAFRPSALVVIYRDQASTAITRETTDLAERYSGAIRNLCRVPVASSPYKAPYEWFESVDALARSRNRVLDVVSSHPNPWLAEGRRPYSTRQILELDYFFLEERLQEVPSNLSRRRLQVNLVQITP